MTRGIIGLGCSARLIIPAAALAAATLIGVAAPAWSAGKTVACSASAYIKDKWGETTNIRTQPSSKSAVAARIAFAKKGSVEVPRTLRLSGQSGAWFRVSQVHSGGQVKFRGRGWIHGSLVAVSIRSRAKLHRGPSLKTPVVGNYAKVDVEASSRVYRCSGGWVYVRDVDTKWAGWLPPGGNCSGRASCE